MLNLNFLKSIELFCNLQESKKINNNANLLLEDNDNLLLISNEKYITSKLISNNNGIKVFVLSNKRNKSRQSMINAYGFKGIFLDRIRPIFLFFSIIKSFFICLKENSDTILNYEIGGIKCGDLIYDSIIMRNNHKYTITSLRNKVAFKEILLINYTYYCIKEIFFKLKPKLFIAQDLVYRDGFISRYAKKYGTDILLITTGRRSYYIKSDDVIDVCFPALYERDIRSIIDKIEPDWESQANKELSDLYQGKGDWNTQNAFKNKIITEKKALLDELNINNGKKTIVVMSHCFSDAPHGNGSGYELYKDYFTWLVETIKIAEKVKDINWLIRPHPSRATYGEEGEVEKICEGKNNIKLMSDKYSTLMVAKIADCIITVNGSAGLELPCMGIPCINAGRPFYSNFGFSICPKTIKEYENLLQTIGDIKPLSEKQICDAKKVFLVFNKIWREDNDYYNVCYDIHQNYCTDKNVDIANIQYIELFCNSVKNRSIQSTYNYKYADKIKL